MKRLILIIVVLALAAGTIYWYRGQQTPVINPEPVKTGIAASAE